jgi:sugar lactone lactonase YvrE
MLLAATAAQAGQTRTWTENDYSDFEKGNIKSLSLRNDGLVTLAPKLQELFDSSSAYLWAIVRDSKGNLYTGGGPGAKLYRISPKGEKKTLAELDGLEIHSLAVDAKDRVYAATAPDGKIYRLSGTKPEVFYDPKQKYIWSMVFDRNGNLFVGTGAQGEIHKVTPDGKGSVFFKTDETHARSLMIDERDNLIVGTDPGGLIFRISPAGQGFVVYQMNKKEITSVVAAKDGSIYAAGVGIKQASTSFPTAPAPSAPQPVPSPVGGGMTATSRVSAVPPAPSTIATASVSGGSEVWHIDASGNPLKLWSNSQDIVYALALDPSDRLLVGTGNKGFVYRLDSDTRYTALVNAPPTQITALAAGPGGVMYAITGNVGKVYQLGPGLEQQGTIESDVFDAGIWSLWGRLEFRASTNGGNIAITTRSGNLDQPQKSWSPWSPAITDPKGARITSPPARFVQWKAIISAGAGKSPELEEVDIAYLPKNIAPRIEQIEITPANYRFPAPAASITPATPNLSLPPIGKRPSSSPSLSLESTSSMQFSKGWIGARWSAADENGDTLIYTVEIRGVNEKEWKLLKDKVNQKHLSWDSTPFPDGEYRIRVTASDMPSNPPEEALSGRTESDPFVIDNTPPRISGLAAQRNSANLDVRWKAADALNNIKKAEYSLDGGEWTVVAPVTRLSDSLELDYTLVLKNVPAGEHTIAVRVEDDYDNQATDKVVVR